MSQILDSIFADHQELVQDLDEVSQPLSMFTRQEPTLLMTARTSRWDKIGPSVLAALRELSSTVQGQQACDLLKRVTKMQEGAANPSPEDQKHFKKYGYYPDAPDTGSTPPRRPFYGDTGRNPRTKDLDPNKYYNPAGTTAKSNKKESLDEIDRIIQRHMQTGLTIVREGNNDAIPQGDHTSPDPALDLQELHSSIGYILPELHALVTSTVGPEKHALLMLFNEVNTSHHELSQILANHNQTPSSDMGEAVAHFKTVQAQMFQALSPYTVGNSAVSRPPYQLKGASLGE